MIKRLCVVVVALVLAGPACQRDHEPAGNGDGRLLWYGNICRPSAPPDDGFDPSRLGGL